MNKAVIIRTNGRACGRRYTAVRPYMCRHYTDEWPQIAYWLLTRQPLYSVSVVMAVVRGWSLGRGSIIVIKLFLSPPNNPFLLPVPIINHTFIITNCYTWKLFLICFTNIVFRSFLCRYCVKIMLRLKRMSDCYRLSEKNVPMPHTPPNPGRDLKYSLTLT